MRISIAISEAGNGREKEDEEKGSSPYEGGQEGREEIDPEEGGRKESRSGEGKAHQARNRALGDSSAKPFSPTRLLRRRPWLGHRREQRNAIRNGRFGRPQRDQRRHRRLAAAWLARLGLRAGRQHSCTLGADRIARWQDGH